MRAIRARFIEDGGKESSNRVACPFCSFSPFSFLFSFLEFRPSTHPLKTTKNDFGQSDNTPTQDQTNCRPDEKLRWANTNTFEIGESSKKQVGRNGNEYKADNSFNNCLSHRKTKREHSKNRRHHSDGGVKVADRIIGYRPDTYNTQYDESYW